VGQCREDAMPEATVPHPLAGKRVLFVLCGFDLGGVYKVRERIHRVMLTRDY